MSNRGLPFRARRAPGREQAAAPNQPGETGVVEPIWRDLRDALPVLRQVSRAVGSDASPYEIITECLLTICRLAGGQSVSLLVGTEELESVLGEDPGDAQAIELAPGAELVVDGDHAQIISDWEGNARPVVLDHGSRLVLPLPRGGAVVLRPESGVLMDPDRVTAMEILLDWANGTVSFATELYEIHRRSRDLEETRRRLREQTMLLTELTVVDELTGLYNRRYLDRQLSFELERYTRYGRALSLAMIDVDFFKKVNDTYGHPVGDAVLRGLAEVGTRTMRNVDLLARVGGEEFCLLMPETDAEGAMVACNRLLENVRDAEFTDGHQTLKITISIGVASVLRPWGGDQGSLFRMADQALYQAKESGRDRIVQTIPTPTEGKEISADPEPEPPFNPSST